MPVVEYQPLAGLSDEQFNHLMTAYMKAFGMALAFSAGPGAEMHAWKQGFMGLLNEGERIGLLTLHHEQDAET